MKDGPIRDAGVPVTRTDVVTGALLRPFFIQTLADHAAHHGLGQLHIIAVEISRFGFVNGSVGPKTADAILVKAAARLRKIFPEALAIGRLHGDHFALAFDRNTRTEADVQKLLDFMERPFALNGEITVLSVRIGAADASCEAPDVLGLLHAAEVALHQTKADLAKVSYFNAAMLAKAQETHALENDLRLSLALNAAELHRAINDFEFFIVYQPIVDIATGTTHAMEALLRWRHPKKGLITPQRFIAMAEDIRVMDVLGSWVIKRACADAAFWPENPDGSQPSISINASQTQFQEPRIFLASIEEALEDTLLPPERIKIEVTESMASTASTHEALDQVRELGCQISLDDFGSGYSSLTQLQRLNIDYLKVDQSFVRNLDGDDPALAREAEELTRSVIALGGVLGLHTIVEGVETQRQLALVRDMGATLIQGFVFSPPLKHEQVAGFIRQRHSS